MTVQWLDWDREIPTHLRDQSKRQANLRFVYHVAPNGNLHIGNFRGICNLRRAQLALERINQASRITFLIADADPVKPGANAHQPWVGVPLNQVPTRAQGFSNIADFFFARMLEVLRGTEFAPDEFVFASDVYRTAEVVRLARLLLGNPEVKAELRGGQHAESSVIRIQCRECGRLDSTNAKPVETSADDGQYVCAYCGSSAAFNLTEAIWKFPFKVEQAVFQHVLSTDMLFQGADHSFSTEASRRIAALAGLRSPFVVYHNLVVARGSGKMAKSANNGLTLAKWRETESLAELCRYFGSIGPRPELRVDNSTFEASLRRRPKGREHYGPGGAKNQE